MSANYISIKVAAAAQQYTNEQLFELRISTVFSVRSLNDISHKGKLVVGSLGIGKREPFWEWGGPDYASLEQYINCEGTVTTVFHDGLGNLSALTQNVIIPCDAYMWVEDDAGLIYDVISRDKIHVAKTFCKLIDIHRPRMLRGVSYSKAKAMGFHYLPAPAEVQALLTNVMMRDSDSHISFEGGAR